MSQKTLAQSAADDVFKTIVAKTFSILDDNLVLAKDAAAKQAAIDKAKKGVELAQASYAEFTKIAETLPSV